METRVGTKKFNIVKVRQEGAEEVISPPPPKGNFESMPQMYLELLENKEKIRQTLVNKDYEPDETMSDISYFKGIENTQQSLRGFGGGAPDPRNGNPSFPRTIVEEDDELMSTGSERPVERTTRQDEFSIDNHSSDEHDEDSFSDSSGSIRNQERPTPPIGVQIPALKPPSPRKSDKGSDRDEDGYDTEEFSEGSYGSSAEGSLSPPRPQPSTAAASPHQLLPQPPSRPQQPMPDIYDKMLDPPPPPQAPRLAELRKAGEYIDNGQNRSHVPDLHRIYSRSEEEEEEMKREILFKFEILKKSYRNLDIPHYTIHTDLKTLTRAYENTLRRVSLDSNVDSYKQYLIGGFMLVEFVASSWFSLDMQGFTQQQILNMNQYERLLIELGEKSYVPGGKAWPVEIRLLGMILMNAFIFIISKIIMKKTGNNLINMMNAFTKPVSRSSVSPPDTSGGGGTASTGIGGGSTTNSAAFRRRMRGPTIDPDDIPDLGAAATA